VYPVFALLAAGAIAESGRRLMREKNHLLISVSAGLVILLMLVFPAHHTYAELSNFMLPDTRELAWNWAKERLPEGARVLQDGYSAPDDLLMSSRFVVQQTSRDSVLQATTPRQQPADGLIYLFSSTSPELSDSLRSVGGLQNTTFAKPYRELAAFAPQPGRSKGPPIRVYRVRQASRASRTRIPAPMEGTQEVPDESVQRKPMAASRM
jgi:hypothetical protein